MVSLSPERVWMMVKQGDGIKPRARRVSVKALSSRRRTKGIMSGVLPRFHGVPRAKLVPLYVEGWWGVLSTEREKGANADEVLSGHTRPPVPEVTEKPPLARPYSCVATRQGCSEQVWSL